MSKLLRERVAENIKRLRVQSGMTQIELARKAQLTDVYISRVENQSRNLTLDSVEQIATALDVDISELIERNRKALPKPNKKTLDAVNHTIKILKAYTEVIT